VVVLEPRERSHMVDVRTVFISLGLVALAATVLLAGLLVASRGRRWFWRATEVGASVFAGGVVVVGLAFTVFFEQAFEIFHRIFFPPGTYTFDPLTEKLVQLFPDQFWVETSLALAVAVLLLSLAVRAGARRLGRATVAAEMPGAPEAGR